jgi:hypothetical protein
MYNNYFSEMKAIREKIVWLPEMDEARPAISKALANFWLRAKFSAKLIVLEKKLVTFAILQWLCIAAGYYLWVRMMGWIPASAWERAAYSHDPSVGDLILLLWSFVCVGLTAFPIGLLSGCMGAVHFLNRQGKESTVIECVKMVLPKARQLWIFHWIDGWWTVTRIFDRLPKKSDLRDSDQRVLNEAIYYAWKVAAIGILPGLVTGRGLIDAGKRSVELVRTKFQDVVFLRAGYSAACWILGIVTYIGTICFFIKFPGLVNLKLGVASQMYKIYFWAGVPLLAGVGVVLMFLRPIYILSSCHIYADYVREQDENLILPPPPGRAAAAADTGAFIAACLLALAVLFFIRYRFELGIMARLAK